MVSGFVLKQAMAIGSTADVGEQSAGSASGHHQIWDVDKLQRYIIFIKEHYQPVLSPEAMVILESYYQVNSLHRKGWVGSVPDFF